MTRGIVIGSRIDIANGFSMTGTMDIQDILRWLLYWDKIAYAGIGYREASISGNHPPEVSYLEDEGVFKTEIVDLQTLDQISTPTSTDINFGGPGGNIWGLKPSEFALASAAARLELSKQLSMRTRDIWTIGQAGGEHLLLPGSDRCTELLDVQLINCLPIPKVGTTFEDVLNFKRRYKDELNKLRHALDDLRETILVSSDERRAIDAAIYQIKTAISDIRKALKGSGIGSVSETIALYTQNPAVGFWTALGGAVAAAKGLPVEVGLAVGIAVPTACRFLRRAIPGGQNLPAGNPDFVYVYEGIRQLGI